jgi:hypothetical protein
MSAIPTTAITSEALTAITQTFSLPWYTQRETADNNSPSVFSLGPSVTNRSTLKILTFLEKDSLQLESRESKL